MVLLEPIKELSSWPEIAGKNPGESGQPQLIDDDAQKIATMVGRQNVSYEPIWAAVEKAYPMWQPVRCNSIRRALLLTSSAVQHRTRMFDVSRRGRLVCIRYLPTTSDDAKVPEQLAAPA